MLIFQNPGLRVFLVSGSPKDIRTLYVAINHRIGKLLWFRISISIKYLQEEIEKISLKILNTYQ